MVGRVRCIRGLGLKLGAFHQALVTGGECQAPGATTRLLFPDEASGAASTVGRQTPQSRSAQSCEPIRFKLPGLTSPLPLRGMPMPAVKLPRAEPVRGVWRPAA